MMGLTVLEESYVSPVACFSKFGDYITHDAIYRQLVTTLYIRLHATSSGTTTGFIHHFLHAQ